MYVSYVQINSTYLLTYQQSTCSNIVHAQLRSTLKAASISTSSVYTMAQTL